MRKVYVRELKPYSLHDLAEKLAPENDAQQIVDWLMERNIIRPYDKFASNEVDSSFEEEPVSIRGHGNSQGQCSHCLSEIFP